MSMTAIELAEQRLMDRRVERTYGEYHERCTSYCAACRAEMDREEGEDGESQ